MSDSIQPSISDLLNQFEAIGGPEEFGPEGIAILIALWRKSSKLGWKKSFQMTNTELTLQTGIRNRGTINTHRSRLAAAGLIDYTSPPNGSSRGDYTVRFNLLHAVEPVQKLDRSDSKAVEKLNSFCEADRKPVENLDSFAQVDTKPVQKLDRFANTVLKDTTTTFTTASDSDQNFSDVMDAFCRIHQKLDIHVKSADVLSMQEMIALGVPSSLIIRVMEQIYPERTTRGAKITSFAYYKNAILDAWKTEQAITGGVPLPTGLPLPTVALGPSNQNVRPYQNKQQQRNNRAAELRRRAEEGLRDQG